MTNTINFNDCFGFNIYLHDAMKQEEIFRELMPHFKKLNEGNEGGYFNYENYQQLDKNHAKIWIRNNAVTEAEIRTILKNRGLVEKDNEVPTSTNYYVYFSNKKSKIIEFEDGKFLSQKENGTKYALEIIDELGVTSQNFDQKKDEIARKIKRDKPNLINDFTAFHFVMNPLSFFKTRYGVGRYQGYQISDIEQDMIDIIKKV